MIVSKILLIKSNIGFVKNVVTKAINTDMLKFTKILGEVE
jgi:hypothetical protein